MSSVYDVVDEVFSLVVYGVNTYNDILGSDAIVYGTSGISNVYELFMTICAANRLGMRAVFFNYPSAPIHFQYQIVAEPSKKLVKDLRLKESEYVEISIAAVEKLSQWFIEANGYDVEITHFALEDILEELSLWEFTIPEYFDHLREIVPRSYIAFRTYPNEKFYRSTKTNLSEFERVTVGKLHDGLGWLSGRGIHYALRLLYEEYGSFVQMIPQAERGEVYQMYSGMSDLPLGYCTTPIRLRTPKQKSWAPIDPTVLLSLLKRWSNPDGELRFLADVIYSAHFRKERYSVLVESEGLSVE